MFVVCEGFEPSYYTMRPNFYLFQLAFGVHRRRHKFRGPFKGLHRQQKCWHNKFIWKWRTPSWVPKMFTPLNKQRRVEYSRVFFAPVQFDEVRSHGWDMDSSLSHRIYLFQVRKKGFRRKDLMKRTLCRRWARILWAKTKHILNGSIICMECEKCFEQEWGWIENFFQFLSKYLRLRSFQSPLFTFSFWKRAGKKVPYWQN